MVMIRPAADGDCERIARLCGQFGYPSSDGQVRDRLSLLAGAERAVLVAADGGLVVGVMQVSVHRVFESGPWAEIDGLVVDESRRGGGIGAALVRAARDWAAEHGMASVRVRTNVVRERAHRFYEREGFALAKTQRVYAIPVRFS